MSLCLDAETSGLDPGDSVHVVSVCDARSMDCVSYVWDGTTTDHLVRAIDACRRASTVVTFNGTGFDFKMMAHHLSGTDKKRAARLALSSYDMMLDFAADKGYYSSLESFLQGSLNTGKTGNGADAIEMWANGDRDAVVQYCEDDARLTARLYNHGLNYGRLERKTKTGKVQVWPLSPELFRTASQALTQHRKAPPDVSWMDSPPDVHAAAAWAVDILSSKS